MRIGIDASRAAIANRTGTENYSLRLVRELIDLDRDDEFILYFRDLSAASQFPENGRVRRRTMAFPRLWTHIRLSWEMVVDAPDVLFVPAHVLPVVHPSRTVVTIHDLGYLYHKDAHRVLDWCYLYLSTFYNARIATRVIADSNATKRDLVEKYNIDPQKITTVYLAQDERFKPVGDRALINNVCRRHGIDGDYFLALGTLQPRKNLMGTISAFAALRRMRLTSHKLVLAGKQGWLSEAIFKKVRSLGIEEHVIFTGYVDDQDLPALLSGATALVFISLYEGFGLPALEAMACGTPVIASDRSALPEVVGDAGILVDPYDTLAVADAMARVATDNAFRAELRQKGLERASLFSWRKCAQQTIEVLRQAVS